MRSADLIREPIGAALCLLAMVVTRWVFGFEWAVMAGIAAAYGKATIARPFWPAAASPQPKATVNVQPPLESPEGDRAIIAALRRNRRHILDILRRTP